MWPGEIQIRLVPAFAKSSPLATGGGIAVAEAESAEAMVEVTAPWGAFFDFRVEPAVPIEDAVPILMKTNAWRDSVS